MRIYMHPEIERGWDLFNDGKIEEALQVINNVEQLEDLSLEDTHNYRMLKGTIFNYMGKFQDSLKIVEEDYQESKKQNRYLFLIDSLIVKFFSLILLGQQPNIREDLVFCEKVIESMPVDALAHIISGAVNESVLWIAQSQNPQKALEEVWSTMKSLLDFMRT